MKKCLFILWLVHTAHCQAQITGIVTDSKTKKPLADVEVFIHGKTPFATTNSEGQFTLEGIHPGFADVVLYKKGYQLFKSSIRLQKGKAYALNLMINAGKRDRGLKTLKSDHSIELRKVKDTLLGKGYVTRYRVMNEETLSFHKDGQGIVIKSSGPVQFEDLTTGYRLYYYLNNGVIELNDVKLSGYVNYQPIQPQGSEQVMTWTTNQLKAYIGSMRHLFKSVLRGKADQEGFEIFDLKGIRINPATLAEPSISNYHKILLTDPVKIVYKTKEGEIMSSQLIPHGSIQINEEGLLLIPENLEVTGSMRNAGLLSPLPQDYEPALLNAEEFMRFYEKIYVHTDKPYYYPGEPLWFKGYVNYYTPTWRDSLSKVVYVELISPQKSVTLSKTLKIDSGFFQGDFILPDTLASGGYYLRAYTNLNRDYGDQNLFVKPVPVLNMTDKADPAQITSEMKSNLNEGLTITSDKSKYKSREEITLNFHLNTDGKPLAANLSVSVTDAVQVVPVADPITMLDGYTIDKKLNFKNIEFKYPAEFGIGYSGRFLNNKGKPEKTVLTILLKYDKIMTLSETDEQGIFSQIGLQFYDTATFSFKSEKVSETFYGKVEILPRAIPVINFEKENYTIAFLKTNATQRFISDYEVPNGAHLLPSVEVKARRIHQDPTNDPNYRINRPYGKPDYILTAKDLRLELGYGNLVLHIQGKVPGLKPDMTFARGGLSLFMGGGPLVMVNDVPVLPREGEGAADVISTIDPNTVESVEFTKRLNVLYGSQGAGGVISIYTKRGVSKEADQGSNFQKIILYGYSLPREFKYPDYDDPKTDAAKVDYRATIYWNPEIITDSKTGTATVSFFAADLPGRYRVVGEGITQNGKPVRCVYFIEVNND